MDNDPYSPPIIVRQMQDLFGRFFLVACNTDGPKEEIVGYIMGGVNFEYKCIGWLLEVYVKENFHFNGIGCDLIKALISIMKSVGITEIRLTVDPQNKLALNIYRKNGFEITDCWDEHYRKNKKVYFMKNKRLNSVEKIILSVKYTKDHLPPRMA